MSGPKIIAHLLESGELIRCLTDLEPERNFIDAIINIEGNQLVTRRGLFWPHGLVDESDLHYADKGKECWCVSLQPNRICPFEPKSSNDKKTGEAEK